MTGGASSHLETADHVETADRVEPADHVETAVLDAVLGRNPTCGLTRILALDGGAAAGKTKFARSVADLATERGVRWALVHTDDLLDGWDGQFGFWSRLRADLLEPICAQRPGRYARYDWTAGRFDGAVTVAAPELLIVEGVSSILACGPYLSFGVFLDVPRPVRERRWARRDGAPLQPRWEHWLDREDGHFAAHPVRADAVLRWPAGDLLAMPRAGRADVVDWSA